MNSAFRLKPKNTSEFISLLLLLLPILILLPGVGGFPYPSAVAKYSDFAVSHYPITYFIKFTLEKWHTVPLWSPDILSGYPLSADPLSGIMYPPGWLALSLPLPLGFNLSIILHLIWGGAGMYLFCRSAGLGHKASIFAALAFEAMPKFFAHYGAGHLTLIYAVSWTPWLLYMVARRKSNLLSHGYDWMMAWEGLILGAIFLADPRWIIYAGLLWWGFGLFGQPKRTQIKEVFTQLGHMIYQSVIAGLIAAPLALPLLEYTRISTRTGLVPEEALTLSLPPSRLLGIVYPELGGFHEWVVYPGALIVLLSLAAALLDGGKGRTGFWLWVTFISLVFALGNYLPLGRLLVKIPVFDLTRVPPRSLFIYGTSLSILAATGLDMILETGKELSIRLVRLALVSVIGFIMMLALGTFVMLKNLPENISWGSILYLVSSIILLWVVQLRAKHTRIDIPWKVYLFVGFLVLLLVDLSAVNTTLFEARPAKEVFASGSDVISYLREQPGDFRVYSPSYSLSQTIAARERLELADGVHPLQLAAYANFMEKASGVKGLGYSVTIPPFATGKPEVDNNAAIPDTKLLGLLNVRYIISEYDVKGENLKQVQRFGNTRLYENPYATGSAWVTTVGSPNHNIKNQIQRYTRSPNQINVDATGPGWLVLSEINYPGWVAYVDGETREIKAANEILRSVWIDEGNHEVEFIFRPMSLYYGLGMAGVGLLIFGFGVIIHKLVRRI